ncbi:MAG: yjbC [Parachlamydiales bacterium]|nr:yjbC [Parachlamydiales bacterium]
MKEKRLSKALAAAGIASRRAAEEMIFEGHVKVNGVVTLVPQTLIDWDKDQIRVDEVLVTGEQRKLYFMLNKPAGLICSIDPLKNRRIVLDLFAEKSERLFTVGRMDQNATGLLLVTNDGHFADKILRSSANIIKEYIVKVSQEITADHLETLSQGARVDDRWVRPVLVQKVRRGTFKICVKEGKKHEVRIITERANLDIIDLKRVRIGGLVLGSLPEGEYRSLTEQELALVQK